VARPRVELHPGAVVETRAAFLWYAERNRTAANAFIAEIDHAVREIQDNPERWPLHLHGTRRSLLRRFPYSVIYRITDEAIQVIAVAHGRRRPGYWRTRQI
jgi:plasmid stabilization system protein ParE